MIRGLIARGCCLAKDVYKRQELDYESVTYLRENFPALEDNIIEDDFLKLNLEKLFDGKPFVLTGNYQMCIRDRASSLLRINGYFRLRNRLSAHCIYHHQFQRCLLYTS